MADALIARRGPLDGLTTPLGLTQAPAQARFILRGRPPALAAAETAFGVAVPQEACRAASMGERHALWLGPDEWLLLAPPEEALAIAQALETAMAGLPHSLVEVTQRQIALTVSGPHATSLLSVGCLLDLDLAAFPVGMCTRTVLAKTEIVLWRRGADSFHIEVWRSFSAYLWGFLQAAGAEFSHGAAD